MQNCRAWEDKREQCAACKLDDCHGKERKIKEAEMKKKGKEADDDATATSSGIADGPNFIIAPGRACPGYRPSPAFSVNTIMRIRYLPPRHEQQEKEHQHKAPGIVLPDLCKHRAQQSGPGERQLTSFRLGGFSGETGAGAAPFIDGRTPTA